MAIIIQLPSDIEKELRRQFPDLDETAREQFVVANYQAGKLSIGDIAGILGLPTRADAQRWLVARHVPLNYSLDDLEQDRQNFEQLFDRK